MKKTTLRSFMLATTLFIATFFTACNTEEVDFQTPEIAVTPSILTAPDNKIGEVTFEVTTNRPWKVVIPADADWVIATPATGNGNGKVTLSLLANSDAPREVDIKVATTTVYATMKQIQPGAYTLTEMFDMTFGTTGTGSGSSGTAMNGYADWGKTAISSGTTTFSGTGNILSSLASTGYPGASGGSNAFLGKADVYFLMNGLNVATGVTAEYVLSFGSCTFTPPFLNSSVKVETSVDGGTTWVVLPCTRAFADKQWGLSTSEPFELAASVTTLNIRFTATDGTQPRLDDIKLVGRGDLTVTKVPVLTTSDATNITFNGAIVNGTYDFTSAATEVGVAYKKSSDAGDVFTKVVGTGTVTFTATLTGLDEKTAYTYKTYAIVDGKEYYGPAKTFTTPSSTAPTMMFDLTFGTPTGTTPIATYTTWGASGQSASTASYDGTNADIRLSSASSGYTGASAGGNVYMGASGSSFTINKINVNTGAAHNYFMTFGNSINAGTFDNTNLKLEVSTDDGTTWSPVAFTREANTSGWKLITSDEFAVAANVPTISIRFTAMVANQIRVDDVILYCVTPNVTVSEIPVVTTTAATEITDVQAVLNGTATFSGTIAEYGFEYKLTTESVYQNIVATSTGLTAFSATIKSLSAGTSYNYKAYVTVAGIKYYGTEEIVTTTGGAASPISALRALGAGTVTTISKIKGTVVSNRATQNIDPKSLVIQDGTGVNSGITVRTAANHAYDFGQEVQVVTAGGALSVYNGLLQFTPTDDTQITLTGTTPLTPVATTITVADLKSGTYESMYIGIAGSQVTNNDLGQKMNGGLTSGYASTGMEVSGTPIATYVMSVKASSPLPATFGNEIVPALNGTLKGIASVNNASYQVMPQFLADFQGWSTARFTSLSFSDPAFTGTLEKGTLISGAKISIPYVDGAGEVLSVSVAVSGAASAGIDAVTAQSVTLATGAGTVEIPITGTPTASGAVTFTISGIDALTKTTVTANVATVGGLPLPVTLSLAGPGPTAAGITGVSPVPVTGQVLTYSNGCSISRLGGAANNITYTYNATNPTIWMGAWDLTDAAWVIAAPLSEGLVVGSQVNVKFGTYGTNAAPKNWNAFYSNDNTTWNAITTGSPYIITTSTTDITLQFTIGSGQAVAVDDKIYIKLVPDVTDMTTGSVNGGAISGGSGNNRLAKEIVISKL